MERSIAKVNRTLIAGTGSGCGKTTVTCAVLSALKARGVDAAAAKCGPDYIDPMFLRSVIGAPSTNLDPFFFDENALRFLLARNSREITVIEGVMGYYDGIGLASSRASAYEAARLTRTPVILAVNAKGASLSILAQIKGFSEFAPDSGIRGAILNNCTEKVYSALAPEIERRLGIRPLGFMPHIKEAEIGSRHLGLVTAAEIADLKDKLARLAEQAEKSLDIDGIVRLAGTADTLEFEPVKVERREPVRIALARDRAFCFYYDDSLDLLREMGAELVDFSPMEDERLPEGIHGLYLGGGYPELHAKRLSENRSMLESVRNALSDGLPCIAECGGFMYLTESIAGERMVGLIKGNCFDAGRLQRFGYVTLTAERDNLLCKKGESIPAHEFHRWDAETTGDCFTARKADGREWPCVIASETLWAGYPHIHLLANTGFAESFYNACIRRKEND